MNAFKKNIFVIVITFNGHLAVCTSFGVFEVDCPN